MCIEVCLHKKVGYFNGTKSKATRMYLDYLALQLNHDDGWIGELVTVMNPSGPKVGLALQSKKSVFSSPSSLINQVFVTY